MRITFLIITSLLVMSCASQPSLDAENEEGFTIDELKSSAEMATYAGAYRDALLKYQAILRKEPENIKALNGVGESLMAAEQPERAILYFERALKVEPSNVDARKGRALSWLMQAKYADAKISLLNLVGDGVVDWRVWNGLGVIADLDAEYDVATSYYKRAIDAEPGNAMLYNNLGYSQIMGHSYAEAESTLNEALLYAPGNQRIMNNLAMAIAWQKRYEDAVDRLDIVMDAAASYNNVGYVAYLNSDYAIAEEYFRKAMSLRPSFYKRAATNLELIKKKNSVIE